MGVATHCAEPKLHAPPHGATATLENRILEAQARYRTMTASRVAARLFHDATLCYNRITITPRLVHAPSVNSATALADASLFTCCVSTSFYKFDHTSRSLYVLSLDFYFR